MYGRLVLYMGINIKHLKFTHHTYYMKLLSILIWYNGNSYALLMNFWWNSYAISGTCSFEVRMRRKFNCHWFHVKFIRNWLNICYIPMHVEFIWSVYEKMFLVYTNILGTAQQYRSHIIWILGQSHSNFMRILSSAMEIHYNDLQNYYNAHLDFVWSSFNSYDLHMKFVWNYISFTTIS